MVEVSSKSTQPAPHFYPGKPKVTLIQSYNYNKGGKPIINDSTTAVRP
jgi:hypothetical protein